MGGRAQGRGDAALRARRRQPAPRVFIQDDGSVHAEGGEQNGENRSSWRRAKYVREQDDADRLDEEFAPRPSAAERPYKDGWRLAKYVRACALNPDPDKPIASFYAWKPGEPWAGIVRGPFFCKSWRCEFGCAEHEAHVMFARMLEAFEPYPSHELVFVVLTLDADFHQLDFSVLDDVYKELRARLEWWRKRLRRQLKKQGLGDFGNRWIAVIEQHESGVPHVNLVMHCPAWASWLETRRLERQKNGQTKKTARLIANTEHRRDALDLVWLKMLNECGFGFASTAEQVRSKEEVLGYSASVARHADETAERVNRLYVEGQGEAKKQRRRRRRRRGNNPLKMLGELAKKRQLPKRAPKGFRRLRSGRGFLPPRQKGDKTGCILHHTHTDTGGEFVRAMTKTKDLDRAKATALCEELERIRVWDERNARENGELAAAIAKQQIEVKDLAIIAAKTGDEKTAKAFVAALKTLGEMKRTRRRRGVEKVNVPPELLERFECGPPRAPPPPPPPDDPPAPAWKPQPLPGVA